MIRRFFSFLIIATLISSCGNTGKKDVTSKAEGSEKAIKVEFASLVEKPDNYVNKNIIVEGKVVHVCTMTGKKLFIVGKNPDVMLFIAAGEDMPKFPMELLGSEVVVEGLITKVGGSEKSAGEKKTKSMEVTQHIEGPAGKPTSDSCATETTLAAQPALANIVMEYKSHTLK